MMGHVPLGASGASALTTSNEEVRRAVAAA